MFIQRNRVGSVFSVLPSSTDPIRALSRRIYLTWLAAIPVVALCAVWAFLPAGVAVQTPSIVETTTRSEQSPVVQPSLALDGRAFAARIWDAPSAPSAPAAPKAVAARAPKRPAFKLELIAIMNDGDERQAALYDPETDRLYIVANGDTVNQHTVTAINADAIELSDGTSTNRLTLKESKS